MNESSGLGRIGVVAFMLSMSWACKADGPGGTLTQCQASAQGCNTALVGGDYEKVVKCTFPKIVEMVGGPEAMIRLIRSGREQMKTEGFDFQGVVADVPKEFVTAGKNTLAIIPTTLTMKAPTGNLLQKAFLLGVSPDEGRTWWFIDGAGLDAEKVKTLIPEFPSTMTLPEKQEPVLVPTAP